MDKTEAWVTANSNRRKAVDESRLWRAFQAGEGAALSELMELHYRTLFHYGSRFTADEDLIKDSIQELFIHLWERRQSVGEPAVVRAYLLACLRRRLHQGSKNTRYLSGWPADDVTDRFNFEISVEEHLIAGESVRAVALEVKAQLENLPRRQKEVIYLRFFEGLERDQIAEVMGIRPQSVSNLLQEAFRQLKTTLHLEFLSLILLALAQ